MTAFEKAVELGFEYLETDVQASKDGHLVVFHDKTLSRMTGENGNVIDSNLSDLQKLKIHSTEPIPLLSELLVSYPNTKINIDPKTDNAVSPLLKLLDEMDVWERVCVASFSTKRIKFLREEAGSKLCTGATFNEVKRLWLSRFGLPTRQIAANCVQVPPKKWQIRVVDERFVSTCHSHGLPVQVWTINDTDEMKLLLDFGSDAIMTDEAEIGMDFFNQQIWTAD